MCGIAGYLRLDWGGALDRAPLKSMCDAIRHRGPDDEGYHFEDEVALGHRRLSIIDLAGGRQPMSSSDGNLTIVFNGEIYNFRELRGTLEAKGHAFRTNSDTEVILYAYREWDAACLGRLNGMFSFALWDADRKTLFCARDRFGKKPFFYALVGGHFVFGSEIKALLQYPSMPREVDREALVRYLALDFTPAPRTIYRHIKKLPGGHFISVRPEGLEVCGYWDLPQHEPELNPPDCRRAGEILFEMLGKASKRRMIADVPLGLFLSGGLDSSSIVAALHGEGINGLNTFNIDFEDGSFSEGRYAGEVASAFGANHRSGTLALSHVRDLIPKVARLFDEPVADGSFLPTYLLCEYTRGFVTVALGGDGGDELLAGYPTYQAHSLAPLYESLPSRLKTGWVEPLVRRLPVSHRYMSFDFKARRFLEGMAYPAPVRTYVWNGSFRPTEMRSLLSDGSEADWATDRVLEDVLMHFERCRSKSFIQKQLYLDLKLYLQEEVLVKVDRTSMAHSLEVRAPMLDVEWAEYVWGLPIKWKFHPWRTKALLRQAAKPHLPRGIVRRKKQGFSVPLAAWFRNELREWMQDVLSAERLRSHGLFKAEYIHELMNEHISGQADHRKKLWNLLTFQLWWEGYGKG